MSNRVIHFKRDEWHTRERLAELLDISVRTLYRRIDAGKVEVKETSEGKRYRVAPEVSEEEVATGATALPDDKSDTDDDTFATDDKVGVGGKSVANELLDMLREKLDELGQLADVKSERGRLEAELRAAQKDVERAVDYAADLEEELDALDADKAHLKERLQKERGRRLQLEDELANLRGQLDALTGARAKYHLERGRREQAEDQRDVLYDKVSELRRELDQLARQLDDEQARKLRLALGSLSIEVRRGGDSSIDSDS